MGPQQSGSEPEGALDLLDTWVRVMSLRTRLLRWYDEAKRDLPWRRNRDPYRILVSELMLQQTRVDVVIPYYERWTERWPDCSALAAATEDEVLAAWSGLGYYRRARSLHAIARHVRDERGGVLPSEPEELQSLPGIGPYTAAAVASIAHDAPVAVVDGNVERVLVRLLADGRLPSAARKRFVAEAARRLVTGLLDEHENAPRPPEGLRAGDWNQAMMELGATICTPAGPTCMLCPWRRSCLGHRAGLAAELPRKAAKKPTRAVTLRAAIVWRSDDTFLLVRRAEGTLLSGLWELPTTEEDAELASLATHVARVLGQSVEIADEPHRSVKHSITTRRITLHVHETRVTSGAVRESGEGVAWIRRQDLRDFGVSSMTRKALAVEKPAVDQ